MSFELDYDNVVHLDAESLAEGGVKAAYDALLPRLLQFISSPTPVVELIDEQAPSYSVRHGKQEYLIYGPDLDNDEDDSWGRATLVFFTIVNTQLRSSTHRLFALNGGNDLMGIFLTESEAQEARKTLPQRTDWPYLPENSHPWYGQYH